MRIRKSLISLVAAGGLALAVTVTACTPADSHHHVVHHTTVVHHRIVVHHH
jgi:hypothetical protein